MKFESNWTIELSGDFLEKTTKILKVSLTNLSSFHCSFRRDQRPFCQCFQPHQSPSSWTVWRRCCDCQSTSRSNLHRDLKTKKQSKIKCSSLSKDCNCFNAGYLVFGSFRKVVCTFFKVLKWIVIKQSIWKKAKKFRLLKDFIEMLWYK